MKKIILFIGFINQFAFSQDVQKCKEIVAITAKAINSKSATELEKYLASDFEISGQKGVIARKILPILVKQLNEKIINFKEINNQKEQGKLTLIYEFTYEKKGVKNTTFVFNPQNQLKSLELFKMKVKTIEKGETKINLPNKNVMTIPFKKVGKLIAVEVLVDNQKRMFLLDTGSPKVVINSRYLPKSTEETLSSSKGVNGTISGANITKIKKIDFSGITMENQKILTLDISHLEKSFNVDFKIHGLIGYELIKDYDLLFDHQNNTVTLIKPTYFKQYAKKHFAKKNISVVPFELQSHIPVFKAKINGKIYNFGLDSGAETNLMSEKLLNKLSKQLTDKEESTLGGVGKTKTKVFKGILKKAQIGNKDFKNMNTLFSSISHLNEGYKLKIDGLMGYELLSKQKTLVSYKRKELIFIE